MGGLLQKKSEGGVQIGLHVGSYSVKAVAVSHAQEKYELLKYSIKPIGDNLSETIKQVYNGLSAKNAPVAVSVAGPSVVVRYVEMPSMTEEELQSAMTFEAEKVIPYKIEDVELDFIKVEDLPNNKISVIIVAVKKDLIQETLKPIEEAGITPFVLDIDSFALMNAFVNAKIDSENLCGLINIGANRTNLNIIKADKSYLARDIGIGGDKITRLLAESMSVEAKEAQTIKEDKLNSFTSLSEEERKDISSALDIALSELADELRLSLDFFENRYASAVGKFYISGGTSKPEIVGSVLGKLFGGEVLRWNPLENLSISPSIDAEALNKVKSELAIAVGLGLRTG